MNDPLTSLFQFKPTAEQWPPSSLVQRHSPRPCRDPQLWCVYVHRKHHFPNPCLHQGRPTSSTWRPSSIFQKGICFLLNPEPQLQSWLPLCHSVDGYLRGSQLLKPPDKELSNPSVAKRGHVIVMNRGLASRCSDHSMSLPSPHLPGFPDNHEESDWYLKRMKDWFRGCTNRHEKLEIKLYFCQF